jgi:hypothetical protein
MFSVSLSSHLLTTPCWIQCTPQSILKNRLNPFKTKVIAVISIILIKVNLTFLILPSLMYIHSNTAPRPTNNWNSRRFPPQNFLCLPRCSYRWWEIKSSRLGWSLILQCSHQISQNWCNFFFKRGRGDTHFNSLSPILFYLAVWRWGGGGDTQNDNADFVTSPLP